MPGSWEYWKNATACVARVRCKPFISMAEFPTNYLITIIRRNAYPLIC